MVRCYSYCLVLLSVWWVYTFPTVIYLKWPVPLVLTNRSSQTEEWFLIQISFASKLSSTYVVRPSCLVHSGLLSRLKQLYPSIWIKDKSDFYPANSLEYEFSAILCFCWRVNTKNATNWTNFAQKLRAFKLKKVSWLGWERPAGRWCAAWYGDGDGWAC